MVRSPLFRGQRLMQVRCAIYTRKSSDEGLDQAFNSLDAQREACEAYIASQRFNGWKVMPARYDDGGLSGGNLERPALQRLLDDIDAGRIEMVVVYKIDRLTRSLADFAKLVERFDAAGASFVSVTQQFNTSTSMGRLTLNVLLSFAQFEREVTAERIRDKIAASKKKGMWMGGRTPLGYDRNDRSLVINQAEAETVRTLFRAYVELGNVRRLKDFADEQDLKTKRHIYKSGREDCGVTFSRGRLYHLLANPVYIGRIRHKDEVYEGQHEAIIDQETWQQVQALLALNSSKPAGRVSEHGRAPLTGKLFDETGAALTPTHAVKKGRRYYYYVSRSLIRDSGNGQEGWRLPARELEDCISAAIRNDPDWRVGTAFSGQEEADPLKAVARAQIFPDRMLVDLATEASEKSFRIEAPFTMARRGVETKLLLAATDAVSYDPALARRIIRSIEWIDEMKAGRTITEIAEAEGISSEFLTKNINAGLLSPAILNAIAEGRQPPHLTAKMLTEIRLPELWPDQPGILQITS
jgi:site-specific DNA recombinase